jgi:lipoprotein-releasing system permease protein
VAAVFEIGMSEYDASFVFMPLPESQAYFNRKDDVTAIEIFTSNPDRIDAFRKAVTERPGGRCSWSTGGSATRPSSTRFRSSAT